jgi:hypothetical protein
MPMKPMAVEQCVSEGLKAVQEKPLDDYSWAPEPHHEYCAPCFSSPGHDGEDVQKGARGAATAGKATSTAATQTAMNTREPWPRVWLGTRPTGREVMPHLSGREPVIRISTSLRALCCQSGPVATLATPMRARRRSIGSRSLRMSPLLIARLTSARSASWIWA